MGSTRSRVRVTLKDGRVAEGLEGDRFDHIFGVETPDTPEVQARGGLITWHQVERIEKLEDPE